MAAPSSTWYVARQGAVAMRHFMSATPIVAVSNIDASVEYFVGALGFTADGVYSDGPGQDAAYAYLSRDDVSIHLERSNVSGMAVYFVVRDVDALYDELREAGAEVIDDPSAPLEGPANQPWGMREVWVRDPDGNVLRFGQPLQR